MIQSIEIQIGTFGGDPLEAQDGSYFDHDQFVNILEELIELEYPETYIETREFGTNSTGIKFIITSDNIKDEEDCLLSCESIQEKAWEEACSESNKKYWHSRD